MKVAHIQWIDSESLRGWTEKDEFKKFIEATPEPIHSVGFLAYEDEKSVVLLQTVGDNVTEMIKIPKAVIRYRAILAELDVDLDLE